MTGGRFICGAASVLAFALALSIGPNPSPRPGAGSFFSRAQAQMPEAGCYETAVPGELGGSMYFRCPSGNYYRDMGGYYEQVDASGNPFPGANTGTATPQSNSANVTAPSGGEPEFKKAPTN